MLSYQVNASPPPPSAVLLAALRDLPTTIISDCLGRTCGSVGLTAYHGDIGRLAAPAMTVRTRPGDNLMIHHALDLAQPGEVLVVDGGGAGENALVGEIMLLYAVQRGLAGFIVDGAIRDVESFQAHASFFCFARSVIHRGPYKDGPGDINVPVSIGGMVVHPGDIVVADADGVIAVRPHEAEAVVTAAQAVLAREDNMKEQISTRGYFPRPDVEEALRLRGIVKP
jgi:regulator of RNase E activity RraA